MKIRQYSDQELEGFLADIEADNVERKESLDGSAPTKVREAICALANDLPDHREPGLVFIGAKDKDGSPSNCPITDELLRQLGDMKNDGNICPFPAMYVQKRHLRGADMAVVYVMPSDATPVKCYGRIWVRTGPRRSQATLQEERILNEKRRSRDLPFDVNPVPSSSVEDLSRVVFENDYLPAAFAPDVLAANGRSYPERLSSCKMIASPDETTPTVLGLLAIGKSPRDYIPGAYVEFLRIAGTSLADPVADSETISGPIAQMIKDVLGKFKAHNVIPVDIETSSQHSFKPIYPSVAFEQIFYNAILHRAYESTNAPVRVYWYEDRIEITSPGGPYGNVTIDNFGRPGVTDYRNPNLAEVLRVFGFVQGFGRGIAVAKKAMLDNGNPEPEFEVTAGAVVATLRRRG